MQDSYRVLAVSDHPLAQRLRRMRRAVLNFTLPAPAVIGKPLLWAYLVFRGVRNYAARILICEPLLKASCKQYGRDVRTAEFIHWIEGKGDIILGDDVLID